MNKEEEEKKYMKSNINGPNATEQSNSIQTDYKLIGLDQIGYHIINGLNWMRFLITDL